MNNLTTSRRISHLFIAVSFIRMKATLHDHNVLRPDSPKHQITFVSRHCQKIQSD